MNKKLKDRLVRLAKRKALYDKQGFDPVYVLDQCGDIDDAYNRGERDGATELAREILDSMDIKYK